MGGGALNRVVSVRPLPHIGHTGRLNMLWRSVEGWGLWASSFLQGFTRRFVGSAKDLLGMLAD